MIKKESRIFLEDHESDFLYQKNESNLNITFNRISFIFFIFFIIFIVYSIHLIQLGSRKSNLTNTYKIEASSNFLYRADIVDRNNKYLVKTVSSIDIGISSKKVIDTKKLILNLKYIFPKKDYSEIEENLKNKNFFYFEKKISEENYEKKIKLEDKSIQSKKK